MVLVLTPDSLDKARWVLPFSVLILFSFLPSRYTIASIRASSPCSGLLKAVYHILEVSRVNIINYQYKTASSRCRIKRWPRGDAISRDPAPGTEVLMQYQSSAPDTHPSRTEEEAPHGCIDSVIYIGHIVEDARRRGRSLRGRAAGATIAARPRALGY